MLAHDPKSSTFHKHATGFFCSMYADLVHCFSLAEQKGRIEKPQILNIISGTGLCVYFCSNLLEVEDGVETTSECVSVIF